MDCKAGCAARSRERGSQSGAQQVGAYDLIAIGRYLLSRLPPSGLRRMRRTKLTLEEIRRLIEERINRLERKRRGGAAFVLGFIYQEFVSVYELTKLASQATLDEERDVYIQWDAENSIDDLFIRHRAFRRFVQIKGAADLSWNRDLVLDFWEDHLAHRHDDNAPSLELCVATEPLRIKMWQNRTNPNGENRNDNNLDFVRVYCVEREWMGKPHLIAEICAWLDDLMLTGFHDDAWECAFSHILDGFRTAGRRGSLEEIFAHVSRLSKGTIVSLGDCDGRYPDIDWLVGRLNEIEELYFAADAQTLVVTMPEGLSKYPPIEVYALEEVYERLVMDVPDSAQKFFDAIRKITREKNAAATV